MKNLNFISVDLENEQPETLETLQTETAAQTGASAEQPLPNGQPVQGETGPGPGTPEPKRGRGRPKKTEVTQEKAQEPKPKKEKKGLVDMLDEYTEKTQAPPLGGEPVPDQPVYKNLITGYMLILVIDTAFPYLALMILKRSSPKWALIKADEIKMSATEKKELEPIADEVAKMVFNNVNPVVAFFVVSGLMYVGKITALSGVAEARFKQRKLKPKTKKVD